MKHVRVWPMGEYPTDSIDLVNERGEVVVTISSTNPNDDGGPATLIEEKRIRVLVEDTEVTKKVVERELQKLSNAMSVTWLYVDSNQKMLELIERLKKRTRGVL